MKLRKIEFGRAIGASGVQGFFSGKEYYHHGVLKYVPGFSFKDMTFVAKTMTLPPNSGNAKLKEDGVSFAEALPDCIAPYFFRAMALNAVGLSNIGAEALLAKNIWQQMTKPFMLSFMTIAKTKEGRLEQMKLFVELLKKQLPSFQAKIALQLNISCPNSESGQNELIDEIDPFLDVAADLGIPLVPKINCMLSHEAALAIAKHPACDALCVSNTIPFGELPNEIPWEKYFHSARKEDSPLARYGGGGLSGKPLFPILCKWLKMADEYSFSVPIIAGGGILSAEDVATLSQYRSIKAISPGSVAFLRPHHVQGIIKTANNIFH